MSEKRPPQTFVEGKKLCIIGEDGDKHCYLKSDKELQFLINITKVENTQVGSNMVVTAEIESTYLKRESEFLRFYLNGKLLSVRELTLDSGEITTIEFETVPKPEDAGEATVEITGRRDKGVKQIFIDRDVTGNIEIIEFKPQCTFPIEGEIMGFFAKVSNQTGSDETDVTVRLEIKDGPSTVFTSERVIDINDGQDKEFVFQWDTDEGDDGRYKAELSVGQDKAFVDFGVLRLRSDPFIAVDIIECPDTIDVLQNDTVEILIQVTNLGPTRNKAGIITEANGDFFSPKIRVDLKPKQKITQTQTWGITQNDVGQELIEARSLMPPSTQP